MSDIIDMSIGREALSGHGKAQGFVCAVFVYKGMWYRKKA